MIVIKIRTISITTLSKKKKKKKMGAGKSCYSINGQNFTTFSY